MPFWLRLHRATPGLWEASGSHCSVPPCSTCCVCVCVGHSVTYNSLWSHRLYGVHTGSSVQGILQAGILDWSPLPSPGDLPVPGIEPRSPTLRADSLSSEPPGKHVVYYCKVTAVGDMLVDCLTEGPTHKSFDSLFAKIIKNFTGLYYGLWIKSGHRKFHNRSLNEEYLSPHANHKVSVPSK